MARNCHFNISSALVVTFRLTSFGDEPERSQSSADESHKRHQHPQSAVVILSIYDDVSTRARAHAAGAAAFVNKSGAIEVLVATIRQAAEQRKT